MSSLLARVFYGPPDWLAYRVTARTRRAINFWAFAVWVFPGFPLWIWWRDLLWFVGFMSLVALWWTGWAGIGSETPVEKEE